MSRMIRVGITHGDINGVGYEIIMKALSDERMIEMCTPVIFGSAKLMTYFRKMFDIEGFTYTVVDSVDDIIDGECNLVNISSEEYKVEIGQATEISGKAAVASLNAAVEAMKNGHVDVLVTAPINKKAVQSDEFNFPGHTEYLEEAYGNGYKAMMLMVGGDLRVALVTTHLALKDIAEAITKESIMEKVRSLHNTLRKDFALERPKIAVLSLNPHNGDDGLLGTEENDIIKPAVEESFDNKIMAFGPYPVDGFFSSKMYEKFDAVLAMYHDQGLAPFKALVAETGINFTAGLPYVRTSPDHGTAYDIAGKGIADATSMREAIYNAIDIYRNRMIYIKSKANPLKKQYVDRGGDKVVLDLTKEEITD